MSALSLRSKVHFHNLCLNNGLGAGSCDEIAMHDALSLDVTVI